MSSACIAESARWPSAASELPGVALTSLGWGGFALPPSLVVGANAPPTCLAASASCAPTSTCDCAAARGFHATSQPDTWRSSDPQLYSGLRVFVLDGHVGPLNDMISFLVAELGVDPRNIDGMYFLQAMTMKKMLDKRVLLRKPPMLGDARNYRELNRFLTFDPKAGAGPMSPLCDKRRCRQAVHDEGIRSEFARLFAPLFAEKVDVVACNFPTWQCLLFLEFNVSVVLRFTHRWDHHLNGVVDWVQTDRVLLGCPEAGCPHVQCGGLASCPNISNASSRAPATRLVEKPRAAGGGGQPQSERRVARMAGRLGRAEQREGRRLRARRRPRSNFRPSIARAARTVLQAMARRPNVIVAASNAYDDVYLRRTTGIAPVAWPGSSQQLAATRYTGTRPEVLFCCGNNAYNKAISRWATLIINGSAARGKAKASPRFAWLSELYPKAHMCREANVSTGGGGDDDDTKLGKKKPPPKKEQQCGYSYDDVASHPLAVLLPYSMHSYGLVQAYSMGIPLLVPSLRLLASVHVATGMASHKGAGNTPWRPSAERRTPPYLNRWLVKDDKAWFVAPPPSADVPCCASEPDDACSPAAAARWLQFADWYQWPHITTFDTPEDLFDKVDALMRDRARRQTISQGMKDFFAAERRRAGHHVRAALKRSLQAAAVARAGVGQRSSLVVREEVDAKVEQKAASRVARRHARG